MTRSGKLRTVSAKLHTGSMVCPLTLKACDMINEAGFAWCDGCRIKNNASARQAAMLG